MPTTPHIERHFTATEMVRDVVIGMSDGLTVPFALAAGISGAGVGTAIVVTAGLAEIAAGSIAMGLGGYMAGQTDIEHYTSELARETSETSLVPEKEREEVSGILQAYGLDQSQAGVVVDTLAKDPARWVNFMMRFELGLDAPNPKRARVSALTIAISYILGGMIPLSPYIFIHNINSALLVSICATLVALFLFGYFKGRFTGHSPLRSGLQTVLVGGVAASAAFLLARLIG
jgi:VIT1/CCC1 family predicted Fe2+/Mn2+ transporter